MIDAGMDRIFARINALPPDEREHICDRIVHAALYAGSSERRENMIHELAKELGIIGPTHH
jgi:hypothetical protein